MAMTNDRTNAAVRDYTKRAVVAAVFTDRTQAERAIDALRAAGFTGKQVGVAMRDRTEAGELIKDTGASAVEGAVSGAVGGGLLGGVAGFLVGLVSALVIPGVGPVIAAGALASVLFVVPARDRVVVEHLNMVKRHQRPTQKLRQGGIIEREASLPISNLMLVCGKCDKATRAGVQVLANGRRARVCRRCGEPVDKS